VKTILGFFSDGLSSEGIKHHHNDLDEPVITPSHLKLADKKGTSQYMNREMNVGRLVSSREGISKGFMNIKKLHA
jgi:hypothetical protein